jgi:hypothetical protein
MDNGDGQTCNVEVDHSAEHVNILRQTEEASKLGGIYVIRSRSGGSETHRPV